METEIFITGQTGGNFKLKNAIQTVKCEVKQKFNTFILIFSSKKEAIKALSQGWESLKSQGLWDKDKDGYIYASVLSYDASIARICE